MLRQIHINLISFSIAYFFISGLTFSQSAMSSANPAVWEITKGNVFLENGEPSNEFIGILLERLASDSAEGEAVTREEFEQFLAQPESKEVYADYIIKYATPHSRHIQKKEHENFSKIFMREKRLSAGVSFLKQYQTLLREVEKKYDVARKDIVSILMWESGLGEFTGNLRVFNVFMGQILFLEQAEEYAIQKMIKEGKKYPDENMDTPESQKRRFRNIKMSAVNSLTALLRYSKKWRIYPLDIKGSWGGAIGYPQFMPYRMDVAVDGDGDGKIDLHTWPDAIYSIANYLRELGNYGWDYKARKKGIYSYNRSNEYVSGVIMYADEIWKRYKNSE